jgi:fructosamine-3-kinase
VSLPPHRSQRRVAGGDINDAYDVVLEDGRRAFVKTRPDAPAGEYAAEAAGLRWLGDGGALVPEVLAVADEHLVLAWLEPGGLGPRARRSWAGGSRRSTARAPTGSARRRTTARCASAR